ncbi:MAG: hypothetical protein HY717_12185 [Planctomycetes bacterium]|nr:hypothetical protein [Planctomycetota bacterium]
MPSLWTASLALFILPLLPGGLPAQEKSAGASTDERLRKIEQELEEQRRENAKLRRDLETIERRQLGLEEVAPPSGDLAREGGEGALAEKAAQLQSRLGGAGGLYAKPFIRDEIASRTYVGGYVDIEYFDIQGQNRRFAQHRLIPMIYADFTRQLKFATEIEFEFGGPDSAAGDGEVKVEFAHIDYQFIEPFGVRAGAILIPLGKFNLIHDSPVNDLTDRPLVDRFIIPTTFTEAGAGFTGSSYPFENLKNRLSEFKLDYEIYLMNGFRGLVKTSDLATFPTGFRPLFSREDGLRDGRASLVVDNNNSVASAGRLALSPFLGTELGASYHVGKYDDRGDNWLAIWALDLTLRPGRIVKALNPVEVLGEFAAADLERDSLARSSGIPDGLWGAYGQVNYHFMFDGLRDALPAVFTNESTFTAVTRFDHVDLDGNRLERLTLGLNFRPIEETVFKFDYQFNFEDWSRREVHNDAVVFSIASYF